MKRCKKVIFSIIAILIIIGGLIAVLQWDNVKALYIVKTHSEKQIEEMTESDRQQRVEAVSGLPVRQLTDEEKNDIKNGEMSGEEALDKIVSIKLKEKDSESDNSSDNSEGSTSQYLEKTDYDAELAKFVGQIYVLEATYTGEIDNLVNSAIEEYKALPAEQHTQQNKQKVGLKYLGKANSLEKTCDQQMATYLDLIEGVLVKSGKDLSLVDKIQSSYENEKIAKKEYYLKLYS